MVVAGMAVLSGLCSSLQGADTPRYFELGKRLVEDFQGTYEFKHKRVEFREVEPSTWLVMLSGDQSPRQDKLVVGGENVRWLRGSSSEILLSLKINLHAGDTWQQILKGTRRTYVTEATGLSIDVPAGHFERCSKVVISWTEHAPDVQGQQRIVLYLAPRLGIIKREKWSNEVKWHEEVLVRYSASAD